MTEVDFGSDWTHAEDFLRAFRLAHPGVTYNAIGEDSEPRRYRATLHVALTPGQVDGLHAAARFPLDPKVIARDALGQMRRNGLYRQYPGTVARLKEIIKGDR